MNIQEAKDRLVSIREELLTLQSNYIKKRNELLADRRELEDIVANCGGKNKVTIMCKRHCYWDNESEYWTLSSVSVNNLAKRMKNEANMYFTLKTGVMPDVTQHYGALRYSACGRTYKLTAEIRKLIIKQYGFTKDLSKVL